MPQGHAALGARASSDVPFGIPLAPSRGEKTRFTIWLARERSIEIIDARTRGGVRGAPMPTRCSEQCACGSWFVVVKLSDLRRGL